MLDETTLANAIAHLSPESRKRLETYVAEANFFDIVLSNDLNGLAAGSQVVEIGSGIGLLSLLTAARGFSVTAYEPQTSGFSEMHKHREIVKTSWKGAVPVVEWRDTYVGATPFQPTPARADFAFAINVMEHVQDIESFIADTVGCLLPGGRFRFICPNYSFPYEPHFEIPTLLNKALTYFVFRRKICSFNIESPLAVWGELSWPNVWKISRMLKRMGLRYSFSRSATEFYLRRVAVDVSFIERKGRTVRTMFRIGNLMSPLVLRFTPTSLMPIIDCTIYRNRG